MNNIMFEITENDIKEYIKSHQRKLDGKEVMFIKYITERENRLTQEMIEMLINKQDIPNIKIYSNLESFDNYLKGTKNLDMSGILHILIPTIKVYGSKTHYDLYSESRRVADIIGISYTSNEPFEEMRLSCEHYKLLGFLGKDVKIEHTMLNKDNINMTNSQARRQLSVYEGVYKQPKVRQITKIIKTTDIY